MTSAEDQPTAVVGAGVIGLLTAWNLRQAGRTVHIIDPAPASEATFAAAGMLAPISEVQYSQQQLWPLMTASRAEYPQVMATLARAVTGETGYWETGTILLAADPGDRDALADMVAVQQSNGMDVEPLTSSTLRRRESSLAPGMAKAWDVPSDHQVDPRLLAAALTEALNAELDSAQFPLAGPPADWIAQRATVVEEKPEQQKSADDGGPVDAAFAEHQPAMPVQITTEDGQTRHYAAAVLSPGLGYGEINGLPEQHPLALRPVYGDVLRLRVRPEQLLPGETQLLNSVVRARVAGRSVYLVPRADGELVVGASSREDGLASTHAGSVMELLTDAATVLPAVREMALHETVTRARPGTPDDRPYLGALPVERGSAVVIATGFHRHGILLAPLGARLATALVTGDPLSQTDTKLLESMRPDR